MDCKWSTPMSNICEHPDNMDDGWYKPKMIMKDKPSDINKNNNCKWFEPKKGRKK